MYLYRNIGIVMLIIFRGKPGVGKSTIAKVLATKLSGTLISKDDINNLIFAKFKPDQFSSSLSYDIIYYLVRILSKRESYIIIDCSLATHSSYDEFTKLATELNKDIKIVKVELDDLAENERRLSARTDWPDHRVKSLRDIEKQQLSYEDFIISNEIVINGSENVESIVNHILAEIN